MDIKQLWSFDIGKEHKELQELNTKVKNMIFSKSIEEPTYVEFDFKGSLNDFLQELRKDKKWKHIEELMKVETMKLYHLDIEKDIKKLNEKIKLIFYKNTIYWFLLGKYVEQQIAQNDHIMFNGGTIFEASPKIDLEKGIDLFLVYNKKTYNIQVKPINWLRSVQYKMEEANSKEELMENLINKNDKKAIRTFKAIDRYEANDVLIMFYEYDKRTNNIKIIKNGNEVLFKGDFNTLKNLGFGGSVNIGEPLTSRLLNINVVDLPKDQWNFSF